MQASLEELMEGTGAASLTVYDEAALCSSAFKVLRGLVHTWLNEVSTHHNHYADLQLQHFYRWVVLSVGGLIDTRKRFYRSTYMIELIT